MCDPVKKNEIVSFEDSVEREEDLFRLESGMYDIDDDINEYYDARHYPLGPPNDSFLVNNG